MVTITAPIATPAPLQVSTLPLPGDIRVTVHLQPTAQLGQIDVAVGLGQGSKGRGERIGDDTVMHVAICRRLACHLNEYARAYELEALAEERDWYPRLAAAACALDPIPAGEIAL